MSDEKIHVLVIEDNKADFDYIKILLKTNDGPQIYQIHHAGTLVKAFEFIGDSKVSLDIILLDLKLPDSQGIKTLKQSLNSFFKIPVIVLTGFDDEYGGREAVKLGAQDYLNKNDLTRELLLHTIKYAIERHQMVLRLKDINHKLHKNIKQISTVLKFSQKINHYLELDHIFYVLKEMAVDLFQAGLFSLFFLNKDEDELKLLVHNHPDWNDLKDSFVLKKGSGIMWDVVKSRETLAIKDFSKSSFTETKRPKYTESGAIILPLISGDQMIGVMNLNNLPDNVFSEDSLTQLRTIAFHLSLALSNALLKENLKKLSTIDELTGLFNRRYLINILEKEIKRSSRFSDTFSVIMFDIDFFKKINDTCGHKCGDDILSQLAEIFQKTLRTVDVACRYGGEEFIIILPGIDESGAFSVSERIRSFVNNKEFKNIRNGKIKQDKIHITLSAGATAFEENDTAETIIGRADKRLYLAKTSGRNRTVHGDHSC